VKKYLWKGARILGGEKDILTEKRQNRGQKMGYKHLKKKEMWNVINNVWSMME
jgi:hypothetical protein